MKASITHQELNLVTGLLSAIAPITVFDIHIPPSDHPQHQAALTSIGNWLHQISRKRRGLVDKATLDYSTDAKYEYICRPVTIGSESVVSAMSAFFVLQRLLATLEPDAKQRYKNTLNVIDNQGFAFFKTFYSSTPQTESYQIQEDISPNIRNCLFLKTSQKFGNPAGLY